MIETPGLKYVIFSQSAIELLHYAVKLIVHSLIT